MAVPADGVLDEPLMRCKLRWRNLLLAEVDQLGFAPLWVLAHPILDRALELIRIKHA